jgi:hypothetical protein
MYIRIARVMLLFFLACDFAACVTCGEGDDDTGGKAIVDDAGGDDAVSDDETTSDDTVTADDTDADDENPGDDSGNDDTSGLGTTTTTTTAVTSTSTSTETSTTTTTTTISTTSTTDNSTTTTTPSTSSTTTTTFECTVEVTGDPECPENMAYIAGASVSVVFEGPMWGGDDPVIEQVGVDAFCIDIFEASQPDATDGFMGSWDGVEPVPEAVSTKCVIPWAYLSHDSAEAACDQSGKRLPSLADWQMAFSGLPWPWGDE